MAATKGFFSVIQFCPDLDRGECANVGVVLVDPARSFLDVRMSADNEGPKQHFGKGSFDDTRLAVAKQAIANRLLHEGLSWSEPEQLRKFGRMEGNNLVLSNPRTILVDEPQAELEELYQRLVHVEPEQRNKQPKPDLSKVFDVKLAGARIRRDVTVDIPRLGKLKVPYAYKNGRLNLVRPEGFPRDERSADAKASELAVKAHLIFNHPGDDGEQRKLVVVGGFHASAPDALKERIEYVLREHDSRLVLEEQLDAFADEIARDAHD
jgi:hypothetical protein